MVISKTQTLSSFARQKNDLNNLLSVKIAASKVTTINKNIDNKFRAEMANVTELLNAIEAKFKKCESIFYTYFEDADHAVLTGNITTLPIGIDCDLLDGTTAKFSNFYPDNCFIV